MRKASSSYLIFRPKPFQPDTRHPLRLATLGTDAGHSQRRQPSSEHLGIYESSPPEPLSDCDRHRDLRDHDCGLGCFCRPNCPRRETPLQQGRESLQFGELDHRLIRKVAHRVYQGLERQWLRWYDAEQAWIPTPVEREQREVEQKRQQAEQERQHAEHLAAQLRKLGIEPEG